MAESAVSSVVETIGNLLIDEAKFLWGVEGKVEDLRKELKLIQCLLRDVDAKPEHGQAVQESVLQLRDIAYDAEDVVERYILRVAQKKGQNIIKAYACFVAKCTCFQVHVVGTEIEGLKSRISGLGTRMQAYGIQPVNESERKQTRASTPKQTYAHFEEDFVGREDSIEELVKELLKDGEQHRVISIWGMGGLGKTSLARKVLAHDKVKNNFDGSAWACVSQDYQMKDIFVEILLKLIPDQNEKVKKMTDQESFEKLYKIQQDKRCIVVLDNIWTKQAWDSLQAAFPHQNTRSKLLITTRNRDVAKHVNPQGLVHELRCLTDLESWKLLKKRAFLETKVIDDDMKRLGDELLKKCSGLPLAVNVLGGLLAVNEWETVYKKINLHFSDEGDVSRVLALSYDDLPWHLKPCFLYFGSFPKDAKFPISKVLRMWIAEGFVLSDTYDEERGITVEDVAHQYLMELVNRGLVQVRFNLSGTIKTCHLHDLTRDLCVSKARKERFLSILKAQQDNKSEASSSSMRIEGESTCKTRRLILNIRGSDEGNMFLRVKQMGRTMLHLRTLMVLISGKFFEGIWEHVQPIFINCKFLRVLKLEDLEIRGNLPESVGDLIHLRYLSLEGSTFEGLPQSLGNLVCMEFLDLHATLLSGVTVPNVLWKMTKLRHLHFPFKFDINGKFSQNRKKLRLDSLKNLQTLRNFCPKNCDVDDVGKMTNLRELTITPQIGFEKLEIILQLAKFTLKHLQSSSFRFESNYSVAEGELITMSSYQHSCKLLLIGEIEKLPEHKNLPQQLRKLVLLSTKLKEDPMPILQKLQHLIVLKLGREAFVGRVMICSAGDFPQLKHLVLCDMPNLEEWRVAEGAMPHLSGLGISRCPKLTAVPVLQGVPTYDGFGKIANEYWKGSLSLAMAAWLSKATEMMKDLEGFSRAEEQEARKFKTSDEEEFSNNQVPALEVSEVTSVNLCEEHERSDEGELFNDEVSSEESSTNLAK